MGRTVNPCLAGIVTQMRSKEFLNGGWAWAPGFALQADSLIGSIPISSTNLCGKFG